LRLAGRIRVASTLSLTKGDTVTSTDTGLGIEAKSEAIYELVEQGSSVERLATGFTFTEGPIWHPIEHHLLFSDMPGDVRRKYTPDGTVVEVKNFSNKGNGMTYDTDLNLLVCEHVTSCLVRESPDGSREIIAQEFEREELNSPNDVCVHSTGAIYFSDPIYGRVPGFGHPRKLRLGFQAVYRIPPGGGDPELAVERDKYEQPNGICFSPDESLMYVNDTPGAYIDVYDADAEGTLSNGRRFFSGVGSGVIEEGIPDGMKCDERGNVWVTGPGGIWVISAEGEHLGTIRVPENTGNLAWGGEDWHTLYIPSSTSLYAIKTIVGPRREPYMR
jgi:gluconolactonase